MPCCAVHQVQQYCTAYRTVHRAVYNTVSYTVYRRLFVVRVNCIFLIGTVGTHRGGGITGVPPVVHIRFRFFSHLLSFFVIFCNLYWKDFTPTLLFPVRSLRKKKM